MGRLRSPGRSLFSHQVPADPPFSGEAPGPRPTEEAATAHIGVPPLRRGHGVHARRRRSLAFRLTERPRLRPTDLDHRFLRLLRAGGDLWQKTPRRRPHRLGADFTARPRREATQLHLPLHRHAPDGPRAARNKTKRGKCPRPQALPLRGLRRLRGPLLLGLCQLRHRKVAHRARYDLFRRRRQTLHRRIIHPRPLHPPLPALGCWGDCCCCCSSDDGPRSSDDGRSSSDHSSSDQRRRRRRREGRIHVVVVVREQHQHQRRGRPAAVGGVRELRRLFRNCDRVWVRNPLRVGVSPRSPVIPRLQRHRDEERRPQAPLRLEAAPAGPVDHGVDDRRRRGVHRRLALGPASPRLARRPDEHRPLRLYLGADGSLAPLPLRQTTHARRRGGETRQGTHHNPPRLRPRTPRGPPRPSHPVPRPGPPGLRRPRPRSKKRRKNVRRKAATKRKARHPRQRKQRERPQRRLLHATLLLTKESRACLFVSFRFIQDNYNSPGCTFSDRNSYKSNRESNRESNRRRRGTSKHSFVT
mmetsp:Transcript_22339/g.72019  ORF Transcript_22339/g.72019 Transcript_22339/m.72019 type:complete len:528 (-) Transcript_22339:173-1756(-)